MLTSAQDAGLPCSMQGRPTQPDREQTKHRTELVESALDLTGGSLHLRQGG
jgi:hypothetical protein